MSHPYVVRPKCSICGKRCKLTKYRTCSKKCSGLARRKPKPRCERCGEPCSQTHRRFCSLACFHATTAGQQRPDRRGPRELRQCKGCKNEFEVGGYGYAWNRIYCSRKCYHRSRVIDADDQPGYKRSSPWRRRRIEILERDKWKCVFCGYAAKSVHHLIPASLGGTHHRDNLATACSWCHGALDRTIHIMQRLNPKIDIRAWLKSFMA
jgi:hypothetical protein